MRRSINTITLEHLKTSKIAKIVCKISKKVVRPVDKAFLHVIQILYIQNLQIWKRIFSAYFNVLQPLKLGKLALGDFVFDKTRMEFKREIVHIMLFSIHLRANSMDNVLMRW